MSYTMYTPLNVWLDPASITDVVAYIQTYLSENTIYSETEIETIIHDYLIAHPELIGGVQSVNGKTGTVVLSASDINTEDDVTIESVLASLSSQISSIAASVATNTNNITSLTGRVSTAETDLANLKSSMHLPVAMTFIDGKIINTSADVGDTLTNGLNTSNASTATCGYMPCNAGDVFIISGLPRNNNASRPYTFVDETLKVLEKPSASADEIVALQLTAPANGYIIVNFLNSNPRSVFKIDQNATYATPEMYGAVGDQVTDDTVAIQSAINSGASIVLMSGSYATTKPIIIDRQITLIHAGSLIYSGNSSAVIIKDINNSCNLHFGTIQALNGNGIEFYATTKEGTINHRVQYADLYFDGISAGDKCIYMNLDAESGLDADNVGWLNEIRIYNGRFSAGNYGIYGDAKGYQKINNIKLYNVGIERVTTGIYMANSCWRWSFMNLRYSESYTTLIETVGSVKDFAFYGASEITMSKNTFSNETFGVFHVPVYESGNLVSSQYLINNGSVVPGSYKTLDRFKFVTIRYNDEARKTAFEHGVIPQTNGMYYVILSTFVGGDTSSIYICRVYNGTMSSFALHEGTNNQAPRIDADGIISKLNSTSTTSIFAYSINLG